MKASLRDRFHRPLNNVIAWVISALALRPRSTHAPVRHARNARHGGNDMLHSHASPAQSRTSRTQDDLQPKTAVAAGRHRRDSGRVSHREDASHRRQAPAPPSLPQSPASASSEKPADPHPSDQHHVRPRRTRPDAPEGRLVRDVKPSQPHKGRSIAGGRRHQRTIFKPRLDRLPSSLRLDNQALPASRSATPDQVDVPRAAEVRPTSAHEVCHAAGSPY